MNPKLKSFILSLVATGGLLTHAQANQTNTFTQAVNATVPDADPTGLTSTLNVSGVDVAIQSISVTLNFSGGYNGDLFVYLAYDTGYAVLLNRVGRDNANPYGYGDSGFNITLSDSAATDVHLYGGNGGSAITGSWQPDGRETDPQLTTSGDSRTAFLSSFQDLNGNGTWTLFVSDLASGYTTTVVSWGLTIATVPEPTGPSLLGMAAGIMAAGIYWRRWRAHH